MRRILVLIRHAFALGLGCLALSACGGDGNDNDGGGSQLKRAIEPAGQERAESMLLTLSDFPDGWRANERAEEDEEADNAFRECVGADFSAFTVIGDAQSDGFATGETATASSEAQVFESEQMAAEAVADFAGALDGEEADACMTNWLGKFEDEDVEITRAEVGELSFTPPPGVDDATAWQVDVTIEGKAGSQAEGLSVSAYVDIVQLRNGDATAEVTTSDIATPFDPELRDELVAAVAGHMSE
jgi:hypothetical protein